MPVLAFDEVSHNHGWNTPFIPSYRERKAAANEFLVLLLVSLFWLGRTGAVQVRL